MSNEAMVLDRIELRLPASRNGVLRSVRRILTNPFVQRIELDSNQGTIVVWAYKNVTEKLSIADLSLDVPELLVSVPITDYKVSYVGSARERPKLDYVLFELYMAGDYPQLIIIADEEMFAESIGLPNYRYLRDGDRGYKEYFGIPIARSELLEASYNAIVVMTSPVADVGPEYSTAGYRVLLSNDNNTKGKEDDDGN